MAFTDPMFQLGMRMTMEKSNYEEFSDLVNKVMNLMREDKCVHYALGFMVQTYIHLADRTGSLNSETEHMKYLEKKLQRILEKSA